MRIAINCRCFMKKQFTGIGRYGYNLVKSLSEIDRANEYFLYAPKDLFDFKRSVPRVSGKNFHVVWDFFRQGPDKVIKDADIYHAPAPEVIAPMRSKVVASVHDLVYKAYPQGHTDSTVQRTDTQLTSITRHADKIICSSESTRKDLMKYFTVPAERVSVIYLGMDLAEFAPLSDDERPAARQLLADKGLSGPYVLFVGTLEPRKNLTGLLKAFASLKSKKRFAGQLAIIGMKGWLNEDLSKLAQDLGIKGSVIFPGFVTHQELRFFYGCAQALLMPSFYEGFGFPIVEAFAIGTPVVTSRVSSCGELAGDAALTVDPYNTDDITAQMDRALNDEVLRRSMKEKGSRRAQEFSLRQTAERTLALYKEVYAPAGAAR